MYPGFWGSLPTLVCLYVHEPTYSETSSGLHASLAMGRLRVPYGGACEDLAVQLIIIFASPIIYWLRALAAEAGPTWVESLPSFQLCVLMEVMEVMGVVGILLKFFGHIGRPPEGPCYHLGDMWRFWRHGSRDGHMDSRQHWYRYLAAVLERPMPSDLTNSVEEYLQAVPREYSKD
jgi:hypothetical protein